MSKLVVSVCVWMLLITEVLLIRKWFGFEVAVLVTLAQMWNVMPTKADIVEVVREVIKSQEVKKL